MTPYYEDAFVTIYHGDCRDVLGSLDPVETCITDPPYGLEFMGKDWDKLGATVVADPAEVGDFQDGAGGNPFSRSRIRYGSSAASMQEWYREHFSLVLDALLPGAMLLSFGGTRTYHRLTCAIEDAGFEIRDCLMFLHGSGFPKAHNFGCKCGGDALPYSHDEEAKQDTEHRMRFVRGADLSEAQHDRKECGEVLLAGVQEPRPPEQGAERADPELARGEQPRMEGRQLRRAGEGIPDDSEPGPSEGEGERLRTGAHSDGREDPGTATSRRRGSAPRRPRQAQQRPVESQNILVSPRTLGDGALGRRDRCPECGGLLAFKGWSSALKPAWEPIVLAMKPLDGTFAQNALEHGVAGLNIDGCRIGTESTRRDTGSVAIWGRTGRMEGGSDAGRWPANVVLDEDAARMLDEQSGETVSRAAAGRNGTDAAVSSFGLNRTTDSVRGHTDSGGASRFFYTGKASRSDRGEHNTHPTVKPSDLMKWLVKLTATPTGGTVLDPFMGSGTTLYAAKELGRKAIGIELNEEYCEIAAKRLQQGVLAL